MLFTHPIFPLSGPPTTFTKLPMLMSLRTSNQEACTTLPVESSAYRASSSTVMMTTFCPLCRDVRNTTFSSGENSHPVGRQKTEGLLENAGWSLSANWILMLVGTRALG